MTRHGRFCRTLQKKTPALLAIVCLLSLTNCQTVTVNNPDAPLVTAPVYPNITWIEEPSGRLSLNKEDAMALLRYLRMVDAYIEIKEMK